VWEVHETGLGPCSVADFGISCVEPSGSSARESIDFYLFIS
jgi:hypothetical protein